MGASRLALSPLGRLHARRRGAAGIALDRRFRRAPAHDARQFARRPRQDQGRHRGISARAGARARPCPRPQQSRQSAGGTTALEVGCRSLCAGGRAVGRAHLSRQRVPHRAAHCRLGIGRAARGRPAPVAARQRAAARSRPAVFAARRAGRHRRRSSPRRAADGAILWRRAGRSPTSRRRPWRRSRACASAMSRPICTITPPPI